MKDQLLNQHIVIPNDQCSASPSSATVCRNISFPSDVIANTEDDNNLKTASTRTNVKQRYGKGKEKSLEDNTVDTSASSSSSSSCGFDDDEGYCNGDDIKKYE